MAKVTVAPDLVMQVYEALDDDTNLVAFKFALPSIVGTVTGARLYLACFSKDGPANADYASKTSADATWTSGSSGAAIAGVAMTSAIETINASLVPIGDWISWDVYTTGANSIAEAYAGTPGNFTVVLDSDYTSSTSNSRTQTTIVFFAEDDVDYQVDFHGPSSASTSLRPYLEIEYTPAAGGDTEQFFKFF